MSERELSGMKIAAISGVKNEADIVESFVRHNAKFIDDFYFIDDSVDGTPQILQQLANEGFRISKIRFDTRDYQHSKVMTNATRLINQKGQYDWIFLLDADEILYFPDKESFLENLSRSRTQSVGIMRHLDFSPNERPFFSSANPLKECFNVRAGQYPGKKIFIRGDLSMQAVIGVGQHDAFLPDGQVYEYFESGIQLAHFQKRTAVQWVTRNILNYTGLIAKLNKIPGEGIHVIEQFNRMKAAGFPIDQASFINLDELTADLPVHLGDIECKYHHLAQKHEVKLLALEMERMANLLSDFRHSVFRAVESSREIEKLKNLISK